MKHFLNLLAAVILCSWCAECEFNSEGGCTEGNVTVRDSSKNGGGEVQISDATLYEQARKISAANQARWDEQSANLTGDERLRQYNEFIKTNPVDVEVIYKILKEEAERQLNAQKQGT